MINESKYDMRGFVLNQISSKNISVNEAQVEQIIEQINAAVLNASQYTDWEVKSNIHAELKIRLRSILDKHQLPIIDELFEEVLSRAKSTVGSPKSYWFVGASYGEDSVDQTKRFLEDGVWQNGYQDKYLDMVRSMQLGDKIAIKSSYTRKRELPFENKGHTVSVMGIKAIGVITRNHGDGRSVEVEWQERFEPVKEWYFYTNRNTVWRVTADDWVNEGLIDFTFNNKPQDINRFRNAPHYTERFGDKPVDKQHFKWTQFYEEFGVKRMKTKWGTCNPSAQRIWLNLELAKKPQECLEYIVVHEMTHLLEPTHNQRFVLLMDRFFPKWHLYKDELNKLPIKHEIWKY